MQEGKEQLIQQLDKHFLEMGQDTETHLEGMLWAKPMTYWDYIHTDALLNLQIRRSTLPDEMVFIMYHQVNELLFKMTLWEAEQLAGSDQTDSAFFAEKLRRISRYFDMLTSSFSIMQDGMDTEQYLKFRNTLTPASGFQSAQYRCIEFISTDAMYLIDQRFRKDFNPLSDASVIYEHLYWQAAGTDPTTGKKNTMIRLFEEKYKADFLERIDRYRHTNLYALYKSLPEAERSNPELIQALRHYDYTVNIRWVMAHYHAAEKYLSAGNSSKEATGGSDWRRYMLPKYQRRIFFPEVWNEQELLNWGSAESPQL